MDSKKNYFSPEILLNVSRETFEQLHSFSKEVCNWSKLINLISIADHADIWNRHVMDCAQLYNYLKPNMANILDIGSGGGFPAIVLAIIAKEQNPSLKFHLVESNNKKAAFLQQMTIKFKLNAIIYNERLENIKFDNINFDLITARAVASIDKLFKLSIGLFSFNTIALLQKGQSFEQELELAAQYWNFDYIKYDSAVNENSVILQINNLRKKQK